jgi:hypothetical protein
LSVKKIGVVIPIGRAAEDFKDSDYRYICWGIERCQSSQRKQQLEINGDQKRPTVGETLNPKIIRVPASRGSTAHHNQDA